MIPDSIAQSFQLYVLKGVPLGGFLQAVLENNLMEAFKRADVENRERMYDIVSYVYNKMPSDCWGSPKKVAAWLTQKAQERAQQPQVSNDPH